VSDGARRSNPPRTFPIKGESRSPAPEMGPRAVRTRTLVMDAARELFLRKGYGGVRIDDIVDAAGVSRGSFYTYFPSKRDVLIAVGTDAYAGAVACAERFAEVPEDWAREDIAAWVSEYVDFLEEYGAFMVVWAHATWDDDELRSVGLRTHLAVARRLGTLVQARRRGPGADEYPSQLEGLTVLAQIERLWEFWQIARAPFSRPQVVDILTDTLTAWLDGAAAAAAT
jgi:AcrR family transcriptional regulator